MTAELTAPITTLPSDTIATGVTWEEYHDKYAEDRTEWKAEGGVITKMSPVALPHLLLGYFFRNLLEGYTLRFGGQVLGEPFVMRLPGISAREPDLCVITSENLSRIKNTYIDGPADLVIEVISPESDNRDRVVKFDEYERGGVREYWLVDYLYEEALFYQRNTDGKFVRVAPDEQGIYTSTVLPLLKLPVALLWRDPVPNRDDADALIDAIPDSPA